MMAELGISANEVIDIRWSVVRENQKTVCCSWAHTRSVSSLPRNQSSDMQMKSCKSSKPGTWISCKAVQNGLVCKDESNGMRSS